MEIVVPLLKLDTVEEDGRFYPSEVLTPAVEAFDRHIRANSEALPGECHPVPPAANTFLNMVNASHVVKHCWVKGKLVQAKLKLVGKYRELSELGVRFGGKARVLTEGTERVTAAKFITVDLLYRDEDDEWGD